MIDIRIIALAHDLGMDVVAEGAEIDLLRGRALPARLRVRAGLCLRRTDGRGRRDAAVDGRAAGSSELTCAIGGALSPLLRCHTPPRRGIQYAAAPRLIAGVRNTASLHVQVMTTERWARALPPRWHPFEFPALPVCLPRRDIAGFETGFALLIFSCGLRRVSHHEARCAARGNGASMMASICSKLSTSSGSVCFFR